MTIPNCDCWKWGDADFSGIDYPGKHMNWILNHSNPDVPRYNEEWDEDSNYCKFCGKEAKEE